VNLPDLLSMGFGIPNPISRLASLVGTFTSSFHEGLSFMPFSTDLMAVGSSTQDLMDQIRRSCALLPLSPGGGKSDGPDSIG
jgi:hypothetical protein